MTRASTLLCGLGLVLAGVAPAIADDAPPGLVPPAATSSLRITGSLIERTTSTTASALTILTRDELLAAGRTMIGDVLQALPAQGNAINAQVNNGGDGATRIDLRGLGDRRTLVLLNGRRIVSVGTGADASVDLNTVPLAVIDRVEVLADAASAVYGSGAIGGVVNIITRTNFSGTEASLYAGQSPHGDGFTYDASFITGHRTENHHGNIVFSVGIESQDPVFAGDRTFSSVDKEFDYGQRRERPSGSIATPGGRIDKTLLVPQGVDICGASANFCTSNGQGGYRPFETTDLYNYQPANYLYTPSSRFNAYTAGSYELRPSVSAFAEASYMHRDSDQQLAPEPFVSLVPISALSIYNPFGADVLGYSRRLDEFGPRATHQSVDTLRLVVGLQGRAPDDFPAALRTWKWELSYNYGRTDATQKTTGNVILSRLRNALGPSFLASDGQPTCGVPGAPIFGCVPMNILGRSGSIGQDAVANTGFTGLTTGLDEQHTVIAGAHGQIARLPHRGDVSAAFTTDLRKDASDFTPDPLSALGDTTGDLAPAAHGWFSVLEAAAELQVVVARDPDGLERAELDLAARGFRYDRFGGVTSSARALGRPVRGVTLRATYATGFREPSIVELFQGSADRHPAAEDPCDHFFGNDPTSPTMLPPQVEAECEREGVAPTALFGTSAQRVIEHGNQDLDPETARVLTAGVVLEPPFVPGLSLSLDYWNIDVRDAIQRLPISAIFERCYLLGSQAACNQIHRDPARGAAISFVDSPTSNAGGAATSGIDVAAVYDRDAPRAGKLHLRADAQWLLAHDLDDGGSVLHGRGNYDLGAFPALKAGVAASWQHPGGAGAGFNLRVVGGFLECDQGDCNHGELSRDVSAYAKIDLFASYAFKTSRGQTLITLGVNNVLDQNPPVIYSGFAADSDAATYDYLGRLIYARLTQLF